jgi:tRNA threonylcarbamoyladenosine biosynthesis protein TsaB
MNILLIDTCGGTGSIALANTAHEPPAVISATLPGRSASERLVATIKEFAARPDFALDSLSVIAVVHGPGSFTGVRVGLSAAKGLCEALHLPLIAVSRLAVLAHTTDSSSRNVLAVFDAGRGEFYLGEYADGIRLHESLVTRDQLLATTKSIRDIREVMVVTCEPAVAQSLAEVAPRLVAEPSAEGALPLVLRRLHEQDFDDIATIDANYLRRTDAEIFAKPTTPAAPHPGRDGR